MDSRINRSTSNCLKYEGVEKKKKKYQTTTSNIPVFPIYISSLSHSGFNSGLFTSLQD